MTRAADYQVKVQIRNGRIIKRMRQLGIANLAQLSQIAGVNYTSLASLFQMRITPKGAKGQWRHFVLNVAAALRCGPEDLFNEQQLNRALKKSSGETFMDAEQVAAISTGGIEALEAKIMVQKLLDSPRLTDRERQCLQGRYFDGQTLEQMEGELGVTKERIRQIEVKALRKLRAEATTPQVKMNPIRPKELAAIIEKRRAAAEVIVPREPDPEPVQFQERQSEPRAIPASQLQWMQDNLDPALWELMSQDYVAKEG